METAERRALSAALSAALLLSGLLFGALSRAQSGPYMDEAFHVPQAQLFCGGTFTQWDPMITTLPGLYLISIGIVKPVGWLFGWSEKVICSTAVLRFINFLFGIGNFYVLYLLFCKMHSKKNVSALQRILSTLTLTVFPVLYFFTFLYYTDVGSAFFTLFSYLMCLNGHHKTSALLGFCGFMFRQTNIVWTVFCAGNVVAQKLSDVWKTEVVKNKEEKNFPEKGSFSELSRVFWFLLRYLLSPKNVTTLIFLPWPYLVVVMAFLTFVALNNGIVVGDRTNHEASLNIPQLFYFFSFTLIFSFPHLLSFSKITRFLRSVWRHWFLYGLFTVVSLVLVWKYTYVHKYLLADNRHYTFYVWRKVFQRHESIKYILVPSYIFSGWSFIDNLKSKSLFWNLFYFLCIFVATVPQKLLEFRYFILPYIIYRLNIPMPSLWKLFLELFFYLLVNGASFYLFLNKPFHWPNSAEIQRFMW